MLHDVLMDKGLRPYNPTMIELKERRMSIPISARLEKYIFIQRQKLQAKILQKEPTEGTLSDRILKLAETDPVLVDTILFDGYMMKSGEIFEHRRRLIDKNKKPEES